MRGIILEGVGPTLTLVSAIRSWRIHVCTRPLAASAAIGEATGECCRGRFRWTERE
jgi:hypothetical protein